MPVNVDLLWESHLNIEGLERKAVSDIRRIVERRSAYGMKLIRNSMKATYAKVKDEDGNVTGHRRKENYGQPSAEGQPPAVHDMQREGLRRLIRFEVVERPGEIAGYVGYLPERGIGELHEFGATKTVRNWLRRDRPIGGIGEVILSPEKATAMRGDPDYFQIKYDRDGRPWFVLYRRSRTAKAAAQANRDNERLYGPNRIQAHWAPRPAVAPQARRMTAALREMAADAERVFNEAMLTH